MFKNVDKSIKCGSAIIDMLFSALSCKHVSIKVLRNLTLLKGCIIHSHADEHESQKFLIFKIVSIPL